MSRWNDRCFLHMDLDAFFASVEQLDHPEYRGKPVIVGGLPGSRRSVVSTASYEARRYGVHSAMPVARALELCPQGIYLRPRMQRYHELSQRVMALFSRYTPDVRQMSVDEAFLDLSGTERLFGDQSETAKKIKQEVFTETGLTISVGLATNRYLAKIASGLSKPDGFYEVLPGQETDFMLSLPLEKVWGIGSKTLDRLHRAGFRTTQDVYKHSRQILVTLFGSATGTFLYNAVRGNEVETFEPAKSHSISNESTYPFDLTDRYTIGTQLMELCQTVMFRLLDEKLSSKTVMLKIRYEDFSTVSIQETGDGIVTSTDDLYERISRLFDTKYEQGRGIRLLGVGLQNVDSGPAQQDLFDFGQAKKQKVEQAILALQKKNPASRIQKARLIDPAKTKKNSLLIYILPLLLAAGLKTPVHADDMNRTQASGAGAIVFDESALAPAQETPASLFQYQINDKHIEFLADGYWETVLKQTSEASFGFGTPFTLSAGSPVMAQQVDMTVWFMLNKTWYFEASFADGFDKNTVAAGYRGDGALKEARVANRGIVFPSSYSIDQVNRGIGGGNNQAPGVSLHFADPGDGRKWTGDFAFRYDMLESHDKTYYGFNNVSDKDIAPSGWLTGQIYVLPADTITAAVSAVYVESSGGSYKDENGRTYKKLASSQWMTLPARSQLLLSSDAGAAKKNGVLPAVAIEFTGTAAETVRAALGTYGTNVRNADGTRAAKGSGFLGAVQDYFGSAAESDDAVTVPNVASFSYGGSGSTPDPGGTSTDGFFTRFRNGPGTQLLLVQHPAGFSPFAAAYRYDGGTTAADDVRVVSASTGKESSLYLAETADDVTFVSDDFFSDKRTYADVYAFGSTPSADAAREPRVRYPFADAYPGWYLGYQEPSDLTVRLRTYTPVARFDIGTKAVPGTVQVYKNGVIDSNVSYDAESGTVTPSVSVSDSDRIYITWYEDSASSDSGAVTAAAGFLWNFTPALSTDLSVSTRWAYSPDKKYADASSSMPGFAAAATRTAWKTPDLELSNTAAVTAEQLNTTGYYRILGMSDAAPQTSYLTKNAAVSLPSGFVPVLNKRPAEAADGTVTMPVLSDSYNGSVKAAEGTTSSAVSGYIVPVSWDFSSWSGTTPSGRPWAATAIKLPSGAALASATKFTIALLSEDASKQEYDLYLQLGVQASSDFTVEDSSSVPTWHIYSSGSNGTGSDGTNSAAYDYNKGDVLTKFDPAAGSWAELKSGKYVSVRLRDEDRARLTAYYNARLIVVMKENTAITARNCSGTILAGPCEITTQGIFTAQKDHITVTTAQDTDTLSNSDIRRFNTSKNNVQKLFWSYPAYTGANAGTKITQTDNNIIVSRYFTEIDLSPYREISMYFRYTYSSTKALQTPSDDPALTFILDRDAAGIQAQGNTAVHIEISAADLKNYISAADEWHKLTILPAEKKVKIDGTTLTGSAVKTIQTGVVPVRLKMTVNTAPGDTAYTSGEFCFDELYLSGIDPRYIVQDAATAAWKKDGVLLSAGAFPLLQDFSAHASGSGAATIQNGAYTQKTESAFSGSTGAAVTAATIQLSGDMSHRAGDDPLSNAGHRAATTVPILGMLSASESYRYDHYGKTLSKSNGAELKLDPLHLPVTLKGETTADANAWSITQKSSASADFTPGSGNTRYTLSTSAQVSQKLLPSSGTVRRIPVNGYGSGWNDINDIAFSSGSADASRRTVAGQVQNILSLPWAGLAPEIDILADGIYKSSTATTFTDSAEIKTVLPFMVRDCRISLSWSKKSGGVQGTGAGGCYSRDTADVMNALADRPWYFKAAPFYDLFSDRLSSVVLEDTTMTAGSTQSLFYTTTYSVSWRRPVYGTAADIWIPSGLTLSAARDIRTAATVNDIYQFKAAADFSAFGIFGSEGVLCWTDLFRHDEYVSSFSALAKVPRQCPKDTTVRYTGYIQANFYVSDTGSLRTGCELSWETVHDWSAKYTVSWKRRGSMSPVLGLIQLFNPDYSTGRITLVRTDSFNCAFSEASSVSSTTTSIIKKQSIGLNHALDLKINQYLTVLTGISGSYVCTWSKSVLLTATASAGARIQF